MQLIEINGNTLHCNIQLTTKIYNIQKKIKNALGLLYISKEIVNNTLSNIESSN